MGNPKQNSNKMIKDLRNLAIQLITEKYIENNFSDPCFLVWSVGVLCLINNEKKAGVNHIDTSSPDSKARSMI